LQYVVLILNPQSFNSSIKLNFKTQATFIVNSPQMKKSTNKFFKKKNQVWIRREDLVNYLGQKQDVADSCATFPFYICFFALSFVLVVYHLRVTAVHEEQKSVAAGEGHSGA
jgi:hypothetical protein